MKAWLSEIFSSIQGEGPYIGERHLFVRFCGCHRDCRYCDTPVDRVDCIAVERDPGSGIMEQVANPLSVDELMELTNKLAKSAGGAHCISLTGGEPLLQSMYLREWLPRLNEADFKIYLETSGDLPDAFKTVVEWIDVVAMDVKLASVGGEPSDFSAHWKFMETCWEWDVEFFVKMVVSADTSEDEFMLAVEGIRKTAGKDTLLVLQPMTAAAKTEAVPSASQLLNWQALAAEQLTNVRVIPQCHKMLDML